MNDIVAGDLDAVQVLTCGRGNSMIVGRYKRGQDVYPAEGTTGFKDPQELRGTGG